jgi:RHS repeat-associated protein
VRFLTDTTGAVTDTYDYDAFGNLIASTGSTPNNYLFAGEQFDPVLGIYYNRARYYDQRQGRFWTMDSNEGDAEAPLSLHKYLYTGNNPINDLDPSGHDDLGSTVAALDISSTLQSIAITSLKGFLFGAGFGAADAALQGKNGDEILEEAIKGGLVGAILGPLAKIKFVAPVLVTLGVAGGFEGTVDAIDQGNYALAAFRATFTLLGAMTFIEPEPVAPEPTPSGGRLGNAATRGQVAEIAAELKNRGWAITGGGGEMPEEYLPGAGGGTKGSNYLDITATKNGKVLRINTIDVLSDGVTPTRREAAAAALIRSKIGSGEHLLLIPKVK